MNKFVDEHTILMREFLRNISTSHIVNASSSTNDPNNEITSSNQAISTVTITVNSNEASSSKIDSTLINHQSSTESLSSSSINSLIISSNDSGDENTATIVQQCQYKEFNCDLIDFGKQLSIFHALLVSIFTTLDKVSVNRLFLRVFLL